MDGGYMKIIIDENGRECFRRICPYCKEEVILFRNDNDAIMFDDKVYHKDCFLKMKSIQKKCYHCKKTFQFYEQSNNYKMYFYMNHIYCEDCFKKLCEEGVAKHSDKWKKALANIEKYKDTANLKVSEALVKKKNTPSTIHSYEIKLDEYVNNVFAEYDLNCFLKSNYKIKDISQFYRLCLVPLYKGTHSKFGDIHIPQLQLLEMWKLQMDYLNKVYSTNLHKGKEFDELGRLKYDLAILVNHYDGYLEWKNKKKVLEARIAEEQQMKNDSILTQYHNHKPMNEDMDNEEEFKEILDDLFDTK